MVRIRLRPRAECSVLGVLFAIVLLVGGCSDSKAVPDETASTPAVVESEDGKKADEDPTASDDSSEVMGNGERQADGGAESRPDLIDGTDMSVPQTEMTIDSGTSYLFQNVPNESERARARAMQERLDRAKAKRKAAAEAPDGARNAEPVHNDGLIEIR